MAQAFDSEILDRLETNQRLTNTARSQVADPTIGQHLAGYQDRYWWMPPDAAFSLAKAGIAPAGSIAAQAAVVAAHVQAANGLGFDRVGAPVTHPADTPDLAQVWKTLDAPSRPAPTADPSKYAAGPKSDTEEFSWGRVHHLADGRYVTEYFQDKGPSKFTVGRDGVETSLDSTTPDAQALLQGILPPSQDQQTRDRAATAVQQLAPNVANLTGADLERYRYEQQLQSMTADQQTAAESGLFSPVTPVVRAVALAANAPLQEVQGQVRNAYEAFSQHELPNILQSQSDLGIAVGDLLGGRPVDIGDGLGADPNSAVAQERLRREQQRGLLDGHTFTLGRGLASGINEVGNLAGVNIVSPDSTAYNLLSGVVDAGAAIYLDPVAHGLSAYGKAAEADKLFTSPGSIGQAVDAYRATGQWSSAMDKFVEAGGLAGIRPTISRDAVMKWWTAPDQAPIRQALTESDNPYAIWRALGRKVDPAVADRLAKATTEQDVSGVILPELGVSLREKPTPADFGLAPSVGSPLPGLFGDSSAPIIQRSSPSRWSATMPHTAVDANDLTANAVELESWGALTKQRDLVPGWFNDMAATQTPLERMAVWEKVQKDTYQALLGKDVPEWRARSLVRMWNADANVERIYATDQISKGLGAFDQQAVVDGNVVTTQSRPHDLFQHLNDSIPLPPARDVRRALSPIAPVLENPVIKGAEWLLERAQQAWKMVQISTPKTAVKVVADEQAAMGARGFDSLFSTHPLSALSAIVATPLAELPEDAGFITRVKSATAGKLRWAVEHVPGVDETGTLRTTATGEDFNQLREIQQVASRGFDSLRSDKLGMLTAEDWKMIPKNVEDPAFLDAWAKNLAHFNASPDMRGVVQAGSLEQAQSWFWDGPGAKLREQLAKASADGHPELLTRAGSDNWVDLSLRQIDAATNGNPELIGALAKGKLGDTPMWVRRTDGSPMVSDAFTAKLGAFFDDAPLATKAQKAIYSTDAARKQLADHFFGRFVHSLLGTPSATLSKSPLFRQGYWQDMIELAPHMTAADQNALLKIAGGEANIGKRALGDLVDAITRGNAVSEPFSGTLTLDHADTIAKGNALKLVQDTTHEFSNRSQLFDMLRLLAPFGEVWRKTIRRWANIAVENPATVRRAQQLYQAAESPQLGGLLGTPAGQGFFHQDQNGQEVFVVPGSEWATQALTGVPVPLVGQVKGLSVGTEFFPALGPVASIPVAWTMEKLHLMDQQTPLGSLGEVLFPYGPPKDAGDLVNYLPSWMQKVAGHDRATSPDSVRTFNNTVMDYVRYGVTNGDYDVSTADGIQKAMEDATNKAHELYVIRGMAQFFVPGAPSPEMLVRDKSGKLLDAAALVAEYRDLSNQDPNTAGQAFLDKYGPDIFRAVTPKSYAYTFGIPTDQASAAWVADHPDLKTNLPRTFGYFAPPSDPNAFDYQLYVDQMQPGQGRSAMTPEQWTRVANARLASIQYGKVLDKVDVLNKGKAPDAGQRAYLAQVKQRLIDAYPGYADALYGGAPAAGLPSRPDPKLLVDEVLGAVDNATVKGTDAGKGLSSYAAAYERVDAAWVASGKSSRSWTQASGQWAVDLRDYLRHAAALVTGAHPQFGPLFDNVFDREMRDDANPAEVGAAPTYAQTLSATTPSAGGH